jgi:hypothetical protein
MLNQRPKFVRGVLDLLSLVDGRGRLGLGREFPRELMALRSASKRRVEEERIRKRVVT